MTGMEVKSEDMFRGGESCSKFGKLLINPAILTVTRRLEGRVRRLYPPDARSYMQRRCDVQNHADDVRKQVVRHVGRREC